MVDDEIRVIFQEPLLSYADADFLLKARRIDALETYLSERIDQLDGHLYYRLLPLAEALEGNGRPLVGSLIYRALLDSILTRAVSKYYHHGVRYLRKLDRLATSVADWKNWPSHSVYLTALHEQNKRKIAFWTKYQAGD